MIKNVTNSLLLCIVLLLLTPVDLAAQATQDQRERRRQFVGDLLKTLMESQEGSDPIPTQPGRPNLRPFPGRDHQPSQPLTPNMISARAKMQAWESESQGAARRRKADPTIFDHSVDWHA